MPKTKAGRLTPLIHQMKKDLEEKKESLSAAERRSLIHRLKRTQRKANLIQKEEDRLAALAKKPEKAAAAETTAAPAEMKVEAKPEETAEAKPEETAEAKPEETAEAKPEEKKGDAGDDKAEA